MAKVIREVLDATNRLGHQLPRAHEVRVRRGELPHRSFSTQSRGVANAGMQVLYTVAGGRTALPLQMQEDLTQRAVFIGGASVSVQGSGPAFSSGGGSVSTGNYRIRVKGYSFDGVTAFGEDHDNWSAPGGREFFRRELGYDAG